MAEREPAFEHSDGRLAPPLNGTAADGSTVRLDGLQGKILVVTFAPAVCGSPCVAQQALLRAVQEGVNITPMRDRVTFLTVGAASDAGMDRSNWIPVTAGEGAANAAASFAALSVREGYAPMIHVIDRGGRHAAIFHGAEFARTNLIVYINALTNAPPQERGWVDIIVGAFW
ncbi:peroxiredoxin family protein [Aurantimonas coralicida]|uniref:peroxiredoxin family protein n=1 Tax=Aurantimonas coralicida TaxID=182270 RepID=UPI001D191427|nr:peroxiredoxin family protein [Aurantimonas coralicida]MCC4300291.1 peroxiredoxin family protein [Aurantimonas coralicida]